MWLPVANFSQTPWAPAGTRTRAMHSVTWSLTYSHESNDAERHLITSGWNISAHSVTDLLSAARVKAGDMDTGPNGAGAIEYLIATRSGRDG
jgi:hypothetical protein